MTLKQGMGARNVAFKCLQMAALSEQDGDREKADHWRKEASGCFRISAEQLYLGGNETGLCRATLHWWSPKASHLRVITGGKPTKP